MKKYLVYVDDSDTVFKVAIAARNEKEARAKFEGSGEIVAIKEIASWEISLSHLEDIFSSSYCKYGKIEKEIILSVLRESGLFLED